MSSKLCPFCMRMTEEETCPHCGKNVNYKGKPANLPAGYVVSGRHPYVLGAALGQGGFGITYIALDMVTNVRVAIKEYYPAYCSVRENASSVTPYSKQEDVYFKGKERFLDEARTLKSLSDLKNIVNVLDFFEANNTAYLVMEFLDGQSLKEHAAKNGKFPARQFLDQIRPLMEDIHRMHERGVIHRDIAPDNIVLQPDGQMKLIDFGAARSFVGDKSMTVVVKKGFAPVEQYMSKGSSAATDVYALAATIYYCITGRVPPDSAARQYDNAPLEAPSAHGADLAPQQEKALLKALEIQQKDRTQSVREFLDDLRVRKPVQQKTVPQRTVQQKPVQQKPVQAKPVQSKPVQQKPVKKKPEKRDSKKKDSTGNRKSSSKKWIPVTAAAVVLMVLILVATLLPDNQQNPVTMPESLSVLPSVPEETVPPTTEPPVPEHVVATATISSQGDLLMHSPVFATAEQSDGTYDFENIFRYSKDLVSSVDYAIVNLETTFGGPEHPHQPNMAFCCPDELATNAVTAGYDMFITANNHSGDSMGDGLIRTLEVAREAGLATLGSQMPGEKRYSIVEINGIKIGMVAYTWAFKSDGSSFSLNGLAAIQDEGQMNYFTKNNPDKLYKEAQQIMDDMKAEGAEATMIQIHWGEDYTTEKNSLQNKIAQMLCDIGFDVIVGGHPHVVQPMELLTSQTDPEHKTVCIYSLGNAVSNQRTGISDKFPPGGYTEDGVFFTTTFEKYSDGTVYLADIDVIPTWVNMHSNDGKKEYNILPLDREQEDQWQQQFHLTDHNFTSCQKSYDRTMGIVGEGLAACQDWLAAQKEAREQYYQDQSLFPPKIEKNEDVPTSTAASETISNENTWEDNILMAHPLSALYYHKNPIRSVTFLDSCNDAPMDAMDVSESKNRSVLAWVETNGSNNDVYFAGEGGINAMNACSGLFMDCTNLISVHFGNAFHTDYVTNMSSMFKHCNQLTELDLSSWNTSHVTDMSEMFEMVESINNLKTLDVSNWDTSSVTTMNRMFAFCNKLTLVDVSNWDTSNTTDMNSMFANCYNLTTLDVGNWDTSNVTDMSWMFYFCKKLTSLDVSKWDTSNVTDMSWMFDSCPKLYSLDVSNWDVSNVESYDHFMYPPAKQINGRPWEEFFTSQKSAAPNNGPTISSSDDDIELKLTHSDISLRLGVMFQLELLNGLSAKDVEWSSSHEHIVSVSDEGVVKGLKEGTAEITVKYGNQTASCIVRVVK